MSELKLTQDDLIAALGVSTRGAVGHYLKGRRPFTVDKLEVLAKKLKMQPGELLDEHPSTPETIRAAQILNELPKEVRSSLLDHINTLHAALRRVAED